MQRPIARAIVTLVAVLLVAVVLDMVGLAVVGGIRTAYGAWLVGIVLAVVAYRNARRRHAG